MIGRGWMPFWWTDYYCETQHLSLEQNGAYLLLIGYYWQHGPLPDDEKKLRRIVRADSRQWTRVWPIVNQFFDLRQSEHAVNVSTEQANAKQLLGKCWRHKRLDELIEKAEEISTKRQIAGQRGGQKSAGKTNLHRYAEQAIDQQTGHYSKSYSKTTTTSVAARARAVQKGPSPQLIDVNRKKGWTPPEAPASRRDVSADASASSTAVGLDRPQDAAPPKKNFADTLRANAAARAAGTGQ
jgi:uncharacterized protein YdaU (DUF1376 family)